MSAPHTLKSSTRKPMCLPLYLFHWVLQWEYAHVRGCSNIVSQRQGQRRTIEQNKKQQKITNGLRTLFGLNGNGTNLRGEQAKITATEQQQHANRKAKPKHKHTICLTSPTQDASKQRSQQQNNQNNNRHWQQASKKVKPGYKHTTRQKTTKKRRKQKTKEID